jgi:integrase/recombinase XerC
MDSSANLTSITGSNKTATKTAVPPLPASAQQFLAQLLDQRRLSPLTQHRYAHALKILHAKTPELAALKPFHLQSMVSQQHTAGLSPRSIAVMVSAWRSYCAWAQQQGYIKDNPTTDVLTPKVSKPLPKAIAVDVIQGFLNQRVATRVTKNVVKTLRITDANSTDNNDDTHIANSAPAAEDATALALVLRDQAMLELLYGCGIRASELIGLDCHKTAHSLGWLDLAVPAIRVLGKGGKPRSVPLPSMALSAIQSWLVQREACFTPEIVALFLGSRGGRISGTELRRATQRRAVVAQSGQGVHPHMLRHSYASHMLQSTGDLRGVQELLGHASIQATQVYTRLDFQHLAKVYDLAHPRSGVKKAS